MKIFLQAMRGFILYWIVDRFCASFYVIFYNFKKVQFNLLFCLGAKELGDIDED